MRTPLRATDYGSFFRMDRASRAALLSASGSWLKDADCILNKGVAPHWGAGSFAIVGKFRSDNGEVFAFRGPLKPFSQEALSRDKIIANHIASVPSGRPACLIDYSFHESAVKINGDWIDVYRMEWVDGELLGDAVDRLCQANDKPSLARLADQWKELLLELESAQIAHGDLQHDNVFVRSSDGSLALIDYDTMYVPGLKGSAAPALGLAGYAHPKVLSGEVQRPYDLTIDTFPGLVILLSLKALAIEPRLKQSDQHFKTKNLLFRKEQLESGDSPSLLTLLKMNDRRLNWLIESLRSFCEAPSESFVSISSVFAADNSAYIPKRKPGVDLAIEKKTYEPRRKVSVDAAITPKVYTPRVRTAMPKRAGSPESQNDHES